MPTGDGSAPTNIECRSSWSARSAFSMRPAPSRASAWVVPSYTALAPKRIAASASKRTLMPPAPRPVLAAAMSVSHPRL